jgi:hypothetical protein
MILFLDTPCGPTEQRQLDAVRAKLRILGMQVVRGHGDDARCCNATLAAAMACRGELGF